MDIILNISLGILGAFAGIIISEHAMRLINENILRLKPSAKTIPPIIALIVMLITAILCAILAIVVFF